MDQKALEGWIDRVHADAILAAGVYDDFLASLVATLVGRGVISEADVVMALDAQQRFIEARLDEGHEVRLQGMSLAWLAERIGEYSARAGRDRLQLRPWRNPPHPGWPEPLPPPPG